VLDSLNRIGIASIASDPTSSTSYTLDPISRSWERGSKVGGGHATIQYTPTVTVSPTNDFKATAESKYETVSHIYAKQVNVEVSWQFKGSTQSINVSSVIR